MNNKKPVRSLTNKANLWTLPDALRQYGRKNLKKTFQNPQTSSARLKRRRDANATILNSSAQDIKK